jgi:hypothetical protein
MLARGQKVAQLMEGDDVGARGADRADTGDEVSRFEGPARRAVAPPAAGVAGGDVGVGAPLVFDQADPMGGGQLVDVGSKVGDRAHRRTARIGRATGVPAGSKLSGGVQHRVLPGDDGPAAGQRGGGLIVRWAGPMGRRRDGGEPSAGESATGLALGVGTEVTLRPSPAVVNY